MAAEAPPKRKQKFSRLREKFIKLKQIKQNFE